MALQMRSVFSERVSSVGYDPETQDFVVQWKRGRISTWAGVPEKIANTVMNAASVGTAIGEMVEGKYPHVYQG